MTLFTGGADHLQLANGSHPSRKCARKLLAFMKENMGPEIAPALEFHLLFRFSNDEHKQTGTLRRMKSALEILLIQYFHRIRPSSWHAWDYSALISDWRALATTRRTKEIGIRKVLGASQVSVFYGLLSTRICQTRNHRPIEPHRHSPSPICTRPINGYKPSPTAPNLGTLCIFLHRQRSRPIPRRTA